MCFCLQLTYYNKNAEKKNVRVFVFPIMRFCDFIDCDKIFYWLRKKSVYVLIRNRSFNYVTDYEFSKGPSKVLGLNNTRKNSIYISKNL